ncbi:MAG: DNA recombination protein RmuC [Opitutales bacterium]|nr:DNA recombination protein RmuC [Opitutales bacterium]
MEISNLINIAFALVTCSGVVFIVYSLLKARKSDSGDGGELAAAEERARNLKADLDAEKSVTEKLRAEKADLDKELAGTRVKLEGLGDLQKEVDRLREENKSLHQQLAGTRAKLDSQEDLEKKQKELSEKMKLEFCKLSSDILKNYSVDFKTTSKSEIDALIKPFSENVSALKKQIVESFKTESDTTNTLKGEIMSLHKQSKAISEQANNLAQALRGNAKIQGNWGETLLKDILERVGLKESVHYLTQNKVEVEGQTRGFTDIEIFLPDNRRLIVDSKVSLTAYAKYCESENEAEKEILKKEHIKSVKAHIDELSGKYKNDLGFVLMFVPVEGAYLLACDSDCWDYALKKNVVLVTGTHLLAVVKLIEQMWRQDENSKKVKEIADLGEKMLVKVCNALEDCESLEKSLGKARESIKNFKTRLNGKGGLVSLAGKMKNCGVKAPNKLETFIDEDEIVDVTEEESL